MQRHSQFSLMSNSVGLTIGLHRRLLVRQHAALVASQGLKYTTWRTRIASIRMSSLLLYSSVSNKRNEMGNKKTAPPTSTGGYSEAGRALQPEGRPKAEPEGTTTTRKAEVYDSSQITGTRTAYVH